MSTRDKIKSLYTYQIDLYHALFFGLFRYPQGLKAFFKANNYLKKDSGRAELAGMTVGGMKILDAGTGSGIILKTLYELSEKKKVPGVKFFGFDLTPAMLSRLEKWLTKTDVKNVEFVEADVLESNQIPKSWGNFDLIVSAAMLEYLGKEDLPKALANLKKLLKKDGQILIFITKKSKKMDLLINKGWKAQTYELEEIKKIMHEVGFKDLTFKRFPSPYSYLNSWCHIIEAIND